MGRSSNKRRKPAKRAVGRRDAEFARLIERAREMSTDRRHETERNEAVYRMLQAKFDKYGHHPAWQEQMGLTCLRLGRTEEAEFYFLRALGQQPDASSVHSYLGFVYFEIADYQKSIQHHKRAMELNHSEWSYYLNFSHVAEKMGLHEDALRAVTIAHRMKKNEPQILFQLGTLCLHEGRVDEGWTLYEAGFACGQRTPPIPRNYNYWESGDIADIADRTVLAWREHGLGDEIRNASLYHDFVAAAGDAIIECEPRLESILRRSFPGARIVPQAGNPATTRRPEFDLHVGQFTLHRHFRKSVDDYYRAAHPEGFLLPDPEKVAFWRARFEALGARAIVGVSWTSGLQQAQRKHNFFRLTDLETTLTAPDVAFVNLFYGDAEEDIRAAEARFGITIHRWPDVDLKNDLETTFAMTKALDLLISAPTSSADIGSAVGTETWSFMPKGTVQRLGTAHLPHAPKTRIFDREFTEPWGPALERAGRAFREWLDGREQEADPETAELRRPARAGAV